MEQCTHVLSYVKDDIQLPTLTPASLLLLRPNQLNHFTLKMQTSADGQSICDYAKYCAHGGQRKPAWPEGATPSEAKGGTECPFNQRGRGDPKGRRSKQNKWKLGILEDLITGKDGIVRAAKLRAGRRGSATTLSVRVIV